MVRSLLLFLGLGLITSLSGCGGDSCESVQDQIEEIAREIQKNPEKALDEEIGKELEQLRDKLQELGCLA